jgi:hypothetical protein
VVGQVLGAHDNNFDENDDEEEAGSVGSNNDDLPSSNISLFNSKKSDYCADCYYLGGYCHHRG